PLPLSSEPLAFMTIRLVASFRSVMSTSPLNDSDTGPILMWTFPLYCRSLTTSVSSAPGMQGATRRGSRRNSQTSSVDAGTVNSFSRWIAMPSLLWTCFVDGGRHLEAPGGPELHQLGQDGHGDLLVGDVAEVEPGRGPEPVERLVGEPLGPQGVQERLGPPAGGDDADPAGRAGQRPLQRRFVVMALGGHHQRRAGPDAGGLEVDGGDDPVGLGPVPLVAALIDDRRPPAQRPGHG